MTAGHRDPCDTCEAILAAIAASVQEQGWPPTVRELADAVGHQVGSSILPHLRALDAAGRIRRGCGARQLAVVASPP